jgi:TolA-binding protein
MSKKNRSITLVFVVLLVSAAILLLSAAAAKVPADTSARIEQTKLNIISSIKDGNYIEAQTQTQKLLADFPANSALPETLYDIAENFRWFGSSDRDKDKYERAGKVYRQIIASFPDSPFASKAQLGIAKTKALSLVIAQDFNSADLALNEMVAAFQNHPNLADELYWVGRAFGYWERHEEEKDAYQRIIQNYPDSPYADKARLGFARANVQSLIVSQDYDGAKQALDKLIADFSNHPDLPEELYWLANRYKYSGKYEQAQGIYQLIIEDYPESMYANKSKLGVSTMNAMSLIMSQDTNQTDKALDKLLTDFEGHPDLPKTLLFIGEQCYNQGVSDAQARLLDQAKEDFEKSVKVWDTLINEFPTSSLVPESCFWQGHCHFKLGKYPESIRWFQKVIDDYPKYEYVWSAQWYISECYEQMKNSAALPEPEAIAQMELAYQKIIENYPASPLFGHACLALANLDFSRNKPAEAASHLEMFLEKDFDDYRAPKALYDLGRAYELMGELDAAAETYSQFIQADPNNPLAETVKARREKLEGANK